MKRKALLLSLIVAPGAFADVGTPLIWATFVYMFIGNALIGLVEGWLLARLFGARHRFTIAIMMGANYVSAWIGAMTLPGPLPTPQTIEDVVRCWLAYIVLFVGVTWLMSVLIEWPFVAVCLPRTPHRAIKSLGVSAVLQSISYVFIVLWIYGASVDSLATETVLVSPRDIRVDPHFELVYIGREGSTWKSDFQGRRRLIAIAAPSDPAKFHELLMFPSFQPVDLRKESEREILVRTGFWAFEGLRTWTQETNAERFALETPLTKWAASNATILPGDHVVFQLGLDQICLFELRTKRIALIARGQRPVVVKGGV